MAKPSANNGRKLTTGRKRNGNNVGNGQPGIQRRNNVPWGLVLVVTFVIVATGVAGLWLFDRQDQYQWDKFKQEEMRRRKAIREQRQKEDAELERRAESLAQRREEKLEEAYDTCIRYSIEHKDKPELVIAYLRKIKRHFEGSPLQKEVEKRIEELENRCQDKVVNSVMTMLEEKAQTCVENREFVKAAAIFRDYQGDNWRVSAKARSDRAMYYADLGEKMTTYTGELAAVSMLVMSHKPEAALKAFNDLVDQERIPDILKTEAKETETLLHNLANINDLLGAHFNNRIGKEETIKVSGRKHTGEIAKADGKGVRFKYLIGKATFFKTVSYDALPLKQRVKILKSSNASRQLLDLYLAQELLKKGEKALAVKYLRRNRGAALFGSMLDIMTHPERVTSNDRPVDKQDVVAGAEGAISVAGLDEERFEKQRVALQERPYAGKTTLDYDSRTVKKYLASLPANIRNLERERFEIVKDTRGYFIRLFRMWEYKGPVMTRQKSFRNAKIALANDHGLLVKDLASGKTVKCRWDDLVLDQFVAFHKFFAEERLTVKGPNMTEDEQKKEAAKEYLMLAVLLDWHGAYGKSLQYAKQAISVCPEIRSKVDKLLLGTGI